MGIGSWFADGRPWIPGERPVHWQGRMITLGQARRVGLSAFAALLLLGATGFVTLALVVGNPVPACVSEQNPSMNDEVDCQEAVYAWCAQNHPDQNQNECFLRAFGAP